MSFKRARIRHFWRPEALSKLREASAEVLQVFQAREQMDSRHPNRKIPVADLLVSAPIPVGSEVLHWKVATGRMTVSGASQVTCWGKDVYSEGLVVAITLAAQTAQIAVIMQRLMELIRTESATLVEIS